MFVVDLDGLILTTRLHQHMVVPSVDQIVEKSEERIVIIARILHSQSFVWL